MRFTPLGDTAVTVELGPEINAATLAPVRALALSLEAEPLPGVVDVVAARAAAVLRVWLSASKADKRLGIPPVAVTLADCCVGVMATSACADVGAGTNGPA